MLPKGNTLPNRNYEAKKILCPMGMQYKKIHSCSNDCILYRNDYEDLRRCHKCGLSRYKVRVCQNDEIDEFTKEGLSFKVDWYLPIIPRFRHLFANADFAKHVRWHADNRKCDGLLRHPTDSL